MSVIIGRQLLGIRQKFYLIGWVHDGSQHSIFNLVVNLSRRIAWLGCWRSLFLRTGFIHNMNSDRHAQWKVYELWRIEQHANEVLKELHQMAFTATQLINGKVANINRSEAQKKRWAALNKINGSRK